MPSSKHLTEAEWQRIAERYRAGESSGALAAAYGIAESTAHYRLTRMEVQMRSVSDARRAACDEHFFDVIDTEEKAYFLGLMASDGWVGDNGQVALGLSGDGERDLIERFRRALKSDARIRAKQPRYPSAQRHYTLQLTSRRLAAALTKHGVTPRKSLTLEFNDRLPAGLMRHYVRGYVDGDGSISIRRDGSALLGVTSSLRFVDGLARYIHTALGLFPHIERYMPPRNPGSGSLKIGGNLVCFIVLDWLYRDATVFLPRKEARYGECKALVAARISAPERLYNLQSNPAIMAHAHRCAELLGVPLRLEEWNGLSVPRSEQDDIVDLYRKGYGVQQIARRRDCSNTLVRNVLTRNGVKLRGVKEQAVAQRRLLIAA